MSNLEIKYHYIHYISNFENKYSLAACNLNKFKSLNQSINKMKNFQIEQFLLQKVITFNKQKNFKNIGIQFKIIDLIQFDKVLQKYLELIMMIINITTQIMTKSTSLLINLNIIKNLNEKREKLTDQYFKTLALINYNIIVQKYDFMFQRNILNTSIDPRIKGIKEISQKKEFFKFYDFKDEHCYFYVSSSWSNIGNIILCGGATEAIIGQKPYLINNEPLVNYLPDFFKEKHNSYLNRFLETGVLNLANHSRFLFFKRIDNYLQPINIIIRQHYDPIFNNHSIFGFCKIIKDKQIVAITDAGLIEGYSELFLEQIQQTQIRDVKPYYWQIFDSNTISLFKKLQSLNHESLDVHSKARQEIIDEYNNVSILNGHLNTFPCFTQNFLLDIINKLKFQNDYSENELRNLVDKYNHYCLFKSNIDYKIEVLGSKRQSILFCQIKEIITVDISYKTQRVSFYLYRWFLLKIFFKFWTTSFRENLSQKFSFGLKNKAIKPIQQVQQKLQRMQTNILENKHSVIEKESKQKNNMSINTETFHADTIVTQNIKPKSLFLIQIFLLGFGILLIIICIYIFSQQRISINEALTNSDLDLMELKQLYNVVLPLMLQRIIDQHIVVQDMNYNQFLQHMMQEMEGHYQNEAYYFQNTSMQNHRIQILMLKDHQEIFFSQEFDSQITFYFQIQNADQKHIKFILQNFNNIYNTINKNKDFIKTKIDYQKRSDKILYVSFGYIIIIILSSIVFLVFIFMINNFYTETYTFVKHINYSNIYKDRINCFEQIFSQNVSLIKYQEGSNNSTINKKVIPIQISIRLIIVVLSIFILNILNILLVGNLVQTQNQNRYIQSKEFDWSLIQINHYFNSSLVQMIYPQYYQKTDPQPFKQSFLSFVATYNTSINNINYLKNKNKYQGYCDFEQLNQFTICSTLQNGLFNDSYLDSVMLLYSQINTFQKNMNYITSVEGSLKVLNNQINDMLQVYVAMIILYHESYYDFQEIENPHFFNLKKVVQLQIIWLTIFISLFFFIQGLLFKKYWDQEMMKIKQASRILTLIPNELFLIDQNLDSYLKRRIRNK